MSVSLKQRNIKAETLSFSLIFLGEWEKGGAALLVSLRLECSMRVFLFYGAELKEI